MADERTPKSPVSFVEGQLSRVVWAAPDGGYAVLRLKTAEQGELTAVGPLASLADLDLGAFVALEGRFEEHPAHGPQFRAVGWLSALPRTLDGIKLYLEGVPGIGPKLSARIVDRFGLETLQVLGKTPWRLAEVKGVKKKAKEIADHWAADERGRALVIALRGLGLSNRLIERIRRRYGDRAADVVERDPYRLAEEISGVGFRTADQIARNQGLPLDHPGRVRAAVLHVVDQAQQDGHCYLPRKEIAGRVEALGVPILDLEPAIDAAASAGRIVIEPAVPDDDPLALVAPHPDDRVFLAGSWTEEDAVSRAIADRCSVPREPVDPAVVAAAEAALGVTLDPKQREAVALALGGGTCIVTGGPGTGKTTLVKVLLTAAAVREQTVLLASPTGRAAKRLEEATGATAATLHRLLEYNPGTGFQRNAGDPLAAELVVVDEASMVDLSLAAALLEAVPPDCGLILVGDADQLPSVGAGQVLRDLIASEVVPTCRLTRIYRQGHDSGIVEAAARVLAGEVPASGEVTGYTDFFLLTREEADRAVETLLSVVSERLPARDFSAMDDVQVLAPTRRGPLGTEALNRALQARLNPAGQVVKRGEREFRVGDRVLCTKNRYDVAVWNGDVGRVTGFDGGGLVVEFDGRSIPWAWEDFSTLDLAYAMTVHKSQGSEYAAVVLALHPSHSIMLQRNLFYTALTRAKRFLCVIGTPRAWARAVRNATGNERYTYLRERVREFAGLTASEAASTSTTSR